MSLHQRGMLLFADPLMMCRWWVLPHYPCYA